MKKDQAVSKNLDLLNEFMKYAFENPDVLEKIPPGAELIILPLNDPELYEYNKGMADRLVSQGEEVVCVKMKIPMGKEGFLITAYPTDKIKEGERIWKR